MILTQMKCKYSGRSFGRIETRDRVVSSFKLTNKFIDTIPVTDEALPPMHLAAHFYSNA